ncbi:LPXTG cell wall anchor domain-containing protein, partial [Microbacterium sp. NPDC089698]|uniref:DUF7507 domain-containing protein n=1 Tax=Microbacterium sp. NPDC089698 TaxID=3364200 RepID=UPI003812443E
AVGLDGQPSAQITAIAPPVPHLTLTKKAIPAELAPNDTEVTYRFTVTNDGQLPLTDVSVSDPGPAGGKGTMSPVTCESNEVLPVGASRDCTATYTASPDDHNGKPLKNTAVANAEADGVAVTSNPATAEVTTIVPAPKLSLTKAAVGGPATSAGQKIQYRFTVTNSGNVDVKTVTVKEGSFSGKGTLGPVVCPADVASLAVEASVTCTAEYTVVAADLTGSPITNTATASGVSAFGPVVSDQADAKVPTVKPASGGLAQTGGDSMLLAGGIAGLLLLSGALTLIIVKRRNSMS